MQLYSPVFLAGTSMPKEHTCLGVNTSPSLVISDIPEATVSMVLIFEDTDATPRPWTHWLLFNIPANTELIHEGRIPDGATEGLANNHSFGYEGPCPRYFSGTHHYWFRLYALNDALDLPAGSEREDVEKAMKGHVIAEASLLVLCTSAEQLVE